jgi:FkbM family methyltransferase
MRKNVISTAVSAAAGARLAVRPWTTNAQGRRIYLNPRDHRAWRLARRHGALDAPAIAAWQRLVHLSRPELVIDIGANYGEVTLSAAYPDAEIHVVEANPEVAKYLQRSLARAEPRAEVHVVAASRSAGEALLRVDPRSSGLSTIEPRDDGSGFVVPTSAIDDLVKSTADRCLFKIDVEGHEPAVLAGMSRILGAGRWWGLVEANHVSDIPAPYMYSVRAGDYGFEEFKASAYYNGGYTKDVVISNTRLL